MNEAFDRVRPDMFMIQVVPSASGDLTGVVQNVRTREKRRFEDLEDLGAALRAMGHST